MTDNFGRSQHLTKTAVVGPHGIVSAQHRVAAEIGAAVLAGGGDCIDAAVATSFAIGVLEPWMSGIGGVGTMVVYRAREDRYETISFGGESPAGLDPRDYPLAAAGTADGLFPWRRVEGDRNLHGPGSIAVPGVVAGLGEAHRRHGRQPWRDLVRPAAALADEGLLVDWYTTLNIATGAAELRHYPTAAAEFLRDGLPPSVGWGVRDVQRLPRPNYAATLRHIADEGARSLYEGDLAHTVADEIAAAGGPLRAVDLAGYRVRVTPSLAIPYRGAVVHATPELTAGPTLAQTLKGLSDWTPAPGARAPDAAAYAAYGRALQQAYRQRLSDMGDVDGKRAVGAEHLPPTCTTHFNVVDAEGNMVSVTQTLLGIFGSKFVTPGTGILMNNGIMWFDPEPGRANSLGGGRRCLANYTPAIAQIGPSRRIAVGASGGRRILPAVAQLLSFAIDYGMDLQAAFDTPRIDASEGAILIGDARLAPEVQAALAADFDFVAVSPLTLPMKFAFPSAALRDGTTDQGATEIFQPWGAPGAAG
jgi:gamma-glutamyltranspeptidase/glutathione hydrolase